MKRYLGILLCVLFLTVLCSVAYAEWEGYMIINPDRNLFTDDKLSGIMGHFEEQSIVYAKNKGGINMYEVLFTTIGEVGGTEYTKAYVVIAEPKVLSATKAAEYRQILETRGAHKVDGIPLPSAEVNSEPAERPDKYGTIQMSGTAVIKVSETNIRKGPDKNENSYGAYNKNTELPVYGYVDKSGTVWYKVREPENNNIGFIMSDYVTLKEEKIVEEDKEVDTIIAENSPSMQPMMLSMNMLGASNVEPVIDGKVTISGPTSVKAQESFDVIISAPGASALKVYVKKIGIDGTEDGFSEYHTSETSGVNLGFTKFDGTLMSFQDRMSSVSFYAVACFDGFWSSKSETLTINVTSDGIMPAPEILECPTQVKAGQSFTVKVSKEPSLAFLNAPVTLTDFLEPAFNGMTIWGDNYQSTDEYRIYRYKVPESKKGGILRLNIWYVPVYNEQQPSTESVIGIHSSEHVTRIINVVAQETSEFALSSIVSRGLNAPVTVSWEQATFPSIAGYHPSYVVRWYGPGMPNEGQLFTTTNTSYSIPATYTSLPGSYAVEVYAVMLDDAGNIAIDANGNAVQQLANGDNIVDLGHENPFLTTPVLSPDAVWVGDPAIITVVTTDQVAYLKSVNNNGYVSDVKFDAKAENGKITWTRTTVPEATDTGRTWTCIAYNAAGEEIGRSDPSNPITVYSKPTVVASPSAIKKGEIITFTVFAPGKSGTVKMKTEYNGVVYPVGEQQTLNANGQAKITHSFSSAGENREIRAYINGEYFGSVYVTVNGDGETKQEEERPAVNPVPAQTVVNPIPQESEIKPQVTDEPKMPPISINEKIKYNESTKTYYITGDINIPEELNLNDYTGISIVTNGKVIINTAMREFKTIECGTLEILQDGNVSSVHGSIKSRAVNIRENGILQHLDYLECDELYNHGSILMINGGKIRASQIETTGNIIARNILGLHYLKVQNGAKIETFWIDSSNIELLSGTIIADEIKVREKMTSTGNSVLMSDKISMFELEIKDTLKVLNMNGSKGKLTVEPKIKRAGGKEYVTRGRIVMDSPGRLILDELYIKKDISTLIYGKIDGKVRIEDLVISINDNSVNGIPAASYGGINDSLLSQVTEIENISYDEKTQNILDYGKDLLATQTIKMDGIAVNYNFIDNKFSLNTEQLVNYVMNKLMDTTPQAKKDLIERVNPTAATLLNASDNPEKYANFMSAPEGLSDLERKNAIKAACKFFLDLSQDSRDALSEKNQMGFDMSPQIIDGYPSPYTTGKGKSQRTYTYNSNNLFTQRIYDNKFGFGSITFTDDKGRLYTIGLSSPINNMRMTAKAIVDNEQERVKELYKGAICDIISDVGGEYLDLIGDALTSFAQGIGMKAKDLVKDDVNYFMSKLKFKDKIDYTKDVLSELRNATKDVIKFYNAANEYKGKLDSALKQFDNVITGYK